MPFPRRSHLDALSRVGRFPRTRAAQLRYDWARRHWPVVPITFGLFGALGVLALLVPSPRQELMAGAFFASAVWAVAYFMEIHSGAATAAMGATAEQWTAADLGRLRRTGWHVAHGVRLRRGGDIDHVALGPGGLIVVETKWSSDGWESRFSDAVVHRGVDHVQRSARDLRLMFPRLTPVTPVVVLWGHPRPAEAVRRAGDVKVVAGNTFADWLRTEGDKSGVAAAEIAAAWKVLGDHARRRDVHDRASQPEARSLTRLVTEVSAGGVGGFAGAMLLVGTTGMWYLPLSLPLAGLTWSLRRRTRCRTLLTAVTVAIGAVAVELIVIVSALFVADRLS